ncbi:MAG: hypothetical protein ACI4MJ_06310 [Aristaeellaceae bacterium]
MLSLLTIAALIALGALIAAECHHDGRAVEEFYKLEYSHKYPTSN